MLFLYFSKASFLTFLNGNLIDFEKLYHKNQSDYKTQ